MRIALLATALVFCLPATSQPNAPVSIKLEAPPCAFPSKETTASDLIQRAATCLDEGKTAQAVPIYFAGQARMRTLAIVDMDPDGTSKLLSSLTLTFGPAINGWSGGDIPQWMVSITDGLDWDKKTPFLELDVMARKNLRGVSEAHAVHGKVRESMYALIGKIRDDRAKIYSRRDELRFPVRDSWWNAEQRRLIPVSPPPTRALPTLAQLREGATEIVAKERLQSGDLLLLRQEQPTK